MMTTRLLLVRHGATTLTADDRFAGSTDVPLGILVIAWLLGLDPRHYRDRLEQQPACLNILDVGPDGARLVLFNDVSHHACAASALPVAEDSTPPVAVAAPHVVVGARDLSALRDRVLAEYREIPDLRLTLGQASRRFGIDRSLAAHVLERLSHDQRLARTPDGAYRRPLEA